jgi:hypothetical protein
MLLSKLVVAVAVVLAGAAGAAAQTERQEGPEPAEVRVRIGPLMMNPTIALTNFGIDTNVLNEPSNRSPKKDVTLTVTPQTELWLRMGRTWLNGVVREDVVWYKTHASERAVNGSYTVGWVVPLNRFRLETGATRRNVKDRPGYEIDLRAKRHEQEYAATAEVRALSRTFFGVTGEFEKVEFDDEAFFLGANLRQELNRRTTAGGFTVRHELTPLTSLTMRAGRSIDRFELSPLRDSDSNSVSLALSFDPFALISGEARVGYRDFKPLSPDLAGYKGATVSVNLSYTLLSSTKFTMEATRDVEYSFSVSQPYYLLTGVGGSIAQQIYGPLDVVGRFASRRLNYRTRDGAEGVLPSQVDRVRTYGFGAGYRVGSTLRVGVDVIKDRRTSDLASRQHEGTRIGTSVTMGF